MKEGALGEPPKPSQERSDPKSPPRYPVSGLRGRFLAISLSMVTVSSALLLGIQETYQHLEARQELVERMTRTAEIQADLIALPAWNLERESIEQVLRAAVRDRDVVSASLLAPQDIIANSVAEPGGKPAMESSVRPVIYRSGGESFRLGMLSLDYSFQRLDAQLQRRLILSASLLLCLLLAVLASVIYADRRVLRPPLNRLTESIVESRISGRRVPVAWEADDELGTLIREYNTMLRQEAAALEDNVRKTTLLEATLESIDQGLCVFDRDLLVVAHNRRYLDLLGHEDDPPNPSTTMESLVRRRHARKEYGSLPLEPLLENRLSLARSGSPYHYSRTNRDGRNLEIHVNPMVGGGLVSTYTDVTDRKEFEAQLEAMALHDALTGLPNRVLFLDRLRLALAVGKRKGCRVAVHFVDLDRFKDINDTLGHAAGDRLLKQLGDELARSTRETDTAARLGGDEFAIVQGDFEDLQQTENMAHRILDLVAQPVELDGRRTQVSASIGITIFPDDAETAEDLLRNADLAMYAAKAAGRGRYQYFVAEMDVQLRRRRRLEDELRVALDEDQLLLHFQPLVRASTRRVQGAEALVRWRHPDLGLLYPDDFISVAQECGLIDELAVWVIRSVCSHLADWQSDQLPCGFRIATNVSASFLQGGDLELELSRSAEAMGISPTQLGIEITESTIMQDPKGAALRLESLRALGVEVSIDDFGTGYSSLNYLRRLPMDTLKIDRSFIGELDRSEDDQVIVRAMIQLGHGLGLSVVAEGVEEKTQAAWLMREGCDLIQGFLYARPMPAPELREWLLRQPSG